MKEQLEHETASYEAQLQERFRGLELQHEDNMRRQKERLSEEMVQTRDEIDSRSRQRIEQIEQEKSAYEKRLRDKYADMARELEMQHTRDAEHWQRKAEDILEEHQIREKELVITELARINATLEVQEARLETLVRKKKNPRDLVPVTFRFLEIC